MAEGQAPETFSPSADELVERNHGFADEFKDRELEGEPSRHLAVVTCMDSRMDILPLLGLGNGEAHIIRNAGGVVTDDVVRSLCLSQRALGTREIILVHHTDCGLQKVNEGDFQSQLIDEVGVKPSWSVESFADPYADVRQSIARLELSPFIKHKSDIRGFVYDVTTGRLDEVVSED